MYDADALFHHDPLNRSPRAPFVDLPDPRERMARMFADLAPEQGTGTSDAVIDGYRPAQVVPKWRLTVTLFAHAEFTTATDALRGYELAMKSKAAGTFPEGSRVGLERWDSELGIWMAEDPRADR